MPLIYVNEEFIKLTGYSRDEVLGKNCRFLQGDDKKQDELKILRKSIKNGESCCVNIINYNKFGLKLKNKLSISPIRNKNGEITHFVGIQDINKF